jgi:quercetin dioxygenase-like cupin family protein
MLVRHTREVRQDDVEMEGAERVRVRWLIAGEDGAPTFAMREFEVAPGGHTPYHSHAWEHEVYVLAGAGVVRSGGTETPLGPGHVVFVPGGEPHGFVNTGHQTLRFLCLVPHTST